MFSAQPACPAAQEVALQQGPPPALCTLLKRGPAPHISLSSLLLWLWCALVMKTSLQSHWLPFLFCLHALIISECIIFILMGGYLTGYCGLDLAKVEGAGSRTWLILVKENKIWSYFLSNLDIAIFYIEVHEMEENSPGASPRRLCWCYLGPGVRGTIISGGIFSWMLH